MEAAEFAPKPVLLADSNDKSATALASLLRSWKYSVEIVHDGPDALTRMRAPDPPTLVLFDDNLTMMSAIEVVLEWRRHPHESPIWTMILSDDTSMEKVVAAKDSGIDDFLIKPVAEADLHLRLRTADRVCALYAELHRSVESLRSVPLHDSETGFWTRDHMLAMLFQETDRVQRMQTPLCLMLIETTCISGDCLEVSTNTTGQLMRQLAKRLRRQLRSYDLIGRYDEDRVLLALPGCTSEHAVGLGQRLVQSLFECDYDVGINSITLAAKCGIAVSKGRSPLVVLREAEMALSQARQADDNCVVRFGDSQYA